MRFYNDTDHRQCPAVDSQGLDCAAPEGHEPPHTNLNGTWADEPEIEPFDPAADCAEARGCPLAEPCELRCHERYLNDERQANDWAADDANAASWRRYYDANPGAEDAARASCDPQTYEGKR